MVELSGRILKGIGGFYYVKTSSGELYECKARGIFRKDGLTPLVGDKVEMNPYDIQQGKFAYIQSIAARNNELIRPPIANIDQLIIVASTQEPRPNTLVIDKLIAIAEYKDIVPVVVISKTDMGGHKELLDVYSGAGIKTILFSALDGTGCGEVKSAIRGKVSALTGNSGVGKSTLLNCIDSSLDLETGKISKKLGRGRHTTRTVELMELNGGYIADTPGFSSIELSRHLSEIKRQDISRCFVEFSNVEACKFTSCSHTGEKGCAVIAAVEAGKISRSRHENYAAIYRSIESR